MKRGRKRTRRNDSSSSSSIYYPSSSSSSEEELPTQKKKKKKTRTNNKDRHLKVNGRGRRVRIPGGCLPRVFELTSQLGYQYDGQTIEWLVHRADELSHLHDKTVMELHYFKTENDKLLSDKIKAEDEVNQLRMKLQEMCQLHDKTATIHEELSIVKRRLSFEEKQRKSLEDMNAKLIKLVHENSGGDFENRKQHLNEVIRELPPEMRTTKNVLEPQQPRDTLSGQRASVEKIYDQVGLRKMVSMLRSEDLEVQIHAVKAVEILAAEDKNQEKIVEEGGLKALLMLLGTSKSATIHQVASGAIANLAMNETNQVLIVSKGGAQLLADIASRTDDPQTLRVVAEAIANLCGNQKLHVMLKEDGVIKVLMKMVLSGYTDAIAEVARGLANFAKYEFRATSHGQRKGPSLLLEDGALTWLISNSTTTSASTRHHIELALCHLAENDDNTQDFISSGALKELARISCGSSKEDVRDLAKKTLKLNPRFQFWMQTNADQT